MTALPRAVGCLGPLLATACAALAAGCASDPLAGITVVGEDPSDVPIEGLSDDWMERFCAGDALFETVFRDATGLGPLYIRQSCSSCHADDARGPGAVTKMVAVDADGVTPSADQSALPFGHTERPLLAAGATEPIRAPDEPNVLVTRRFGPAVFARGYLEAIDESEIARVEAEQAARDDGVSGRVNRVAWQSEATDDHRFHAYGPGSMGLVGRFGLKGRIATVDEFVADAYQGDMGITSALRPSELPNPEGLDDDELLGVDVDADTVGLVADYVRLLRLPERRDLDPDGERLFGEIGCATCHVPSLRTRADYPIAELAGIDAPLYTDVLVHDMGPALADGLVEGSADGREWKTAPLVGLRFLPSYLHDGRARTIADAIEMHGGDGSEASAAAAAFGALSSEDRDAVVRFVSHL